MGIDHSNSNCCSETHSSINGNQYCFCLCSCNILKQRNTPPQVCDISYPCLKTEATYILLYIIMSGDIII